jgi:CheY-like chemotaxis protein
MTLRYVLHAALQQDGYEVEAVCSGRQALTAIARNRPALLVLDLQMTELDDPSVVDTPLNQNRLEISLTSDGLSSRLS